MYKHVNYKTLIFDFRGITYQVQIFHYKYQY